MAEIIELSKEDYMITEITGEMGGGKGGGGHQPVEADDTLSSKQTAKVLLLLGEGEIDSIEQVYLNRTPISNFPGASYQVRTGTSNQTVMTGFNEIESLASGFSQAQITTTTPYTKAFDYDVAAVRLTFTLPSLREIKDNADIVGFTVTLEVKTKNTNPDVFVTYKNVTKKGKASSPYSWDFRVSRPSGAVPGQQWSIRVNRSSPDDNDSKHNSVTTISGVTELRHPIPAFNYPNCALLGLTLKDAAQFGGRIPEITIKLKGEKIYLPTNYNPVTRTYNETTQWNGSFKTVLEYTNNPVWWIYHILSQRMDTVSTTDIDVGSFYFAAKYCDQFISDGNGGTEPRFTINNAFVRREDTYKFLSYLLTVCNANFTDNEFGQISLMIDAPGQAVTKIVTNANVIDGEFNYSSNDLENRFSSVNVTYNEPDLLGDTQTTTFTDQNLVDRYGLQTSDIILAGCYSEAQAIRKAKWAIYTNSYDTEFISFSQMLAGAGYKVGELVKILDAKNSGFDWQGIIKSSSINAGTVSLALDRPVTLTAVAYTVSFLNSAGTPVVFNIQQTNGSFTTLTYVGSLSVLPNTPFVLATAANTPIVGKVVKILKDGNNYAITCVRHNEQKYSTYIESNVVKIPRPNQFVNLSNFTVTSPFNVAISALFVSNGVTKTSYLNVTWQWTQGSQNFKPRFTVMWRRDNQNFRVVNDLLVQSYDIANPAPGQYEVVVFATNPVSNMKSPGSTLFVYNYRNASAGSTLDPVITARVKGTTGLTFETPDLNIEILHNPANDAKLDKLKDYIVEVWTADGLTKKSTTVVPHDVAQNGLFTLSFAENVDTFGAPTRTFQLKIFCRDMMGDISTAKVLSPVTNPVPAIVPSFTVVSGINQAFVNIEFPAGNDVAGFKVWRDTISTFTPGIGNQVYKGASSSCVIPGVAGATYFYKVAAYDTFGDANLNISSAISSAILSNDAIQWQVVSGLQFKQNDPVANSISWTAGTVLRQVGSATPTVYNIAAGNTAWTAGVKYLYFNPTVSTTVLQNTTTLATAVSGWIIGSYSGGTNFKGGTGEAYTDGSTIIAGTVGANQLVVNSAVITGQAQLAAAVIGTAQIIDGNITDAKIGNEIKSSNYNAATFDGWRIDKAGNIVTFGALDIRDSSGNVILTTGAGAGVQYSKVIGKTGFASITQITPTNVSTYIASAAIKGVHIGTAEINTAHIIDANVNTLKIAGNAVTVPSYIRLTRQVRITAPANPYQNSFYNKRPVYSGWATLLSLRMPPEVIQINYAIEYGLERVLEVNTDSPTLWENHEVRILSTYPVANTVVYQSVPVTSKTVSLKVAQSGFKVAQLVRSTNVAVTFTLQVRVSSYNKSAVSARILEAYLEVFGVKK